MKPTGGIQSAEQVISFKKAGNEMHVVVYDGVPLSGNRIASLLEQALKQGCGDSVEMTVSHTEDELVDAMMRMVNEKTPYIEEYFPFNAKDGFHLLDLSRVCYFRSSAHRIWAVFCDGTALYSKTIRVSAREVLAPLLDGGRFIQTFKSCFVNISQIHYITVDGIQMLDGSVLPVSRKYYNELTRKKQEKLPCLKPGGAYRVLAFGGGRRAAEP